MEQIRCTNVAGPNFESNLMCAWFNALYITGSRGDLTVGSLMFTHTSWDVQAFPVLFCLSATQSLLLPSLLLIFPWWTQDEHCSILTDSSCMFSCLLVCVYLTSCFHRMCFFSLMTYTRLSVIMRMRSYFGWLLSMTALLGFYASALTFNARFFPSLFTPLQPPHFWFFSLLFSQLSFSSSQCSHSQWSHL